MPGPLIARLAVVLAAVLLAACDAGTDRSTRADTTGDSIPDAPRTGQVRFVHAPPDGTRFVETIFTRERFASRSVTRYYRDREVRVAVAIARSDADALFTVRVLSARSWLGGAPKNEPELAALVGRELSYRVGPDGAQIERTEPDAEATISELLDLSWDRRMSSLAGLSVPIGGSIEVPLPYSFEAGPAFPIPRRVSVPRHAQCPTGRCVLLWLDFALDESAASGSEVLRWMHSRGTDAESRPTGIEISQQESLVIDPDTMLIYEYTGTGRFAVELDAAPGAIERSQEWRRTYDYSAPAR